MPAPLRFTPEVRRRIVDACASGASQVNAARAAGVGVSTLTLYLRDDPTLRAELAVAKAKAPPKPTSPKLAPSRERAARTIVPSSVVAAMVGAAARAATDTFGASSLSTTPLRFSDHESWTRLNRGAR